MPSRGRSLICQLNRHAIPMASSAPCVVMSVSLAKRSAAFADCVWCATADWFTSLEHLPGACCTGTGTLCQRTALPIGSAKETSIRAATTLRSFTKAARQIVSSVRTGIFVELHWRKVKLSVRMNWLLWRIQTHFACASLAGIPLRRYPTRSLRPSILRNEECACAGKRTV